jgi:hypothetical protein
MVFPLFNSSFSNIRGIFRISIQMLHQNTVTGKLLHNGSKVEVRMEEFGVR